MSYTTTSTFTRTNARHIASKIGADLRQMNKFYDNPSEEMIEKYITEITELLAAGYLSTFEWGFKRNDERVVSVKYTVRADGTVADGGPGRVYAKADISGASDFSYVTYSAEFNDLSQAEREAFKQTLPFQRTPGEEAKDGSGYWVNDRAYSSGGVGAERGMFRPTT